MMFYSRRVYKTGGINSILESGLHMPLFDLDNVNIRDVETEALRLQEKYELGDAVIINTGRQDSYHLYFMSAKNWRECIRIGVECRYVDLKHIQFSLKRKHFTLRVLSKAKRKLYLQSVVESRFENTATKNNITSFVLYETANK